jgi:NADH dehydrogenase [ubiquinone] 1 alpha subcomplex assembly factor 7
MSLLKLIQKKIAADGPISIAEYMELALAHPEFGYYMKKDPLGKDGDFITSPEISQIFGELTGLWLSHQWEKIGKPNVTLAELGPGRGTLMADMLRATKKIPGFHEAISVRLMEISPALKQKQWNTLAGKHHDIEWIDSLNALAKKPLLLIANEFFDALPICQFVHQDNAWHERLVDDKNGQLKFVIASAAKQSNLPTNWIASSHTPRNDEIIETCVPALNTIKHLSKHIAKHSGAALIIDYGYTEGTKGDTLQAMRGHQYFEILGKPGSADITAHVDFKALKQAAESAGTNVFGPTPQGKFLMKIGAGHRVQKLVANASPEQGAALISGLERLASPDKMGDLFKVIAITSGNIEHAEGF